MNRIILFVVVIVILSSPSLAYAHAGSGEERPSVVSEAAIVMDSETGTVLYEKSSKSSMYPASLTKIATAIYAIEIGDLDDVVTVSENASDEEGTSVFLNEGEQVKLKKLVQGLLINSGNDAGVAIAEHLSGSVEQFSTDLNAYLKNEIGVQYTHFENPHGLYDPNHVTTAEDLAKITKYAMKNQTFRDIFGTVELKWNGESWDTTLLKHHKLVRQVIPYKGATGGKTGYVSKSGFTLATTAERNDLNLIVITLNSNLSSASYNDTKNLLNYGFENFERSSVAKGTTFKAGEQTYKTSEELRFTHMQGEQVNREVNEDGTLDIVREDGTIINSYHLDKLSDRVKINESSTVNKDIKTNSMFGDYFPMLVITAIIIVLSLLVLFYSRKRI
ncbi:D-alanyl-D-alanine carboxypeptidase [Virgibacillus subterraneus]|uniref:D-alanyl-D-alanine carboxypeptidase n=2 Tax=Virgibacillus TaxID=84406 RepID=A0A1H1GGM2_9BACI|nr:MULTISPECIES: D-alanyl-D-alanine carboxypeptidase family protein [Virgibacillus]SDR12239.1 D-alanyl-D-alanine carboxypeptidase [Virgibacillus salinus]SEQ81459.1 D-alanyl-D-alanine carboxypeptidase [Virgibacillus subterraneus]